MLFLVSFYPVSYVVETGVAYGKSHRNRCAYSDISGGQYLNLVHADEVIEPFFL